MMDKTIFVFLALSLLAHTSLSRCRSPPKYLRPGFKTLPKDFKPTAKALREEDIKTPAFISSSIKFTNVEYIDATDQPKPKPEVKRSKAKKAATKKTATKQSKSKPEVKRSNAKKAATKKNTTTVTIVEAKKRRQRVRCGQKCYSPKEKDYKLLRMAELRPDGTIQKVMARTSYYDIEDTPSVVKYDGKKYKVVKSIKGSESNLCSKREFYEMLSSKKELSYCKEYRRFMTMFFCVEYQTLQFSNGEKKVSCVRYSSALYDDQAEQLHRPCKRFNFYGEYQLKPYGNKNGNAIIRKFDFVIKDFGLGGAFLRDRYLSSGFNKVKLAGYEFEKIVEAEGKCLDEWAQERTK